MAEEETFMVRRALKRSSEVEHTFSASQLDTHFVLGERVAFLRRALVALVGITLYSAVGCGGDNKDGNGDSSSDTDIEVDSAGTPTSGDGDGDGGIDGCSASGVEGCTGITYEGENIPLDIYVMFDLSCSMSCTVDQQGCCRESDDAAPENEWRIQPVREAMRLFLEDSRSNGIGVGLGFFGDHSVDNPDDPQTCSVAAHEDAAVGIAGLPDAAEQLVATLEAGEPQGGTPTHLAIGGACEYTNAWKQDHPGHKVVILLVTDGIPEHSCDADIRQAVDAAESCYADGEGREIYVLGVVANNNNSLDQLNGIAEAGGTEHAYLTDTNDVAGSVLSALNAIRADAVIPCTLNIPEPSDGAIDYGKVNIGICDAAEKTVRTYFVDDPEDCALGAWYYEEEGSDRVVQLCEPTCETVTAAGASLTLSVGCTTVTDPIR